MKAFILVGGKGSGKTTLAKKLIKNVNRDALFIFDTNNEYKEIYPYPFNPDFDAFINRAEQMQKAVILAEDVTAFLSNRGYSAKLVQLMVAQRHTLNTVILLFHSMRTVPKYLMDLATDVFIFKTNDDPKYVRSEFKNERLFKTWESVQECASKNPFYKTQPPPKNTVPCMAHYTH